MHGHIVSIHFAPVAGAPMREAPHIIAQAGLGLEGDRYAHGRGSFSKSPADRELTLIEAEAIERLAAEHGISLAPGESRRNITTRGVRLNDLVGVRFKLGEVVCLGTRLCDPCFYLERITQHKGLARLLAASGGLRARILTDGVIFAGDTVETSERT